MSPPRTDEAVAPCESAMGSERSSGELIQEATVASSSKKRDARREGALLVLFTPEERALVDAAAEHTSITSGAFVRMIALREARKIGPEETSNKRRGKAT